MVLRYWGASGVWAEEFSGSLNPERTGIPADTLVALALSRGFQAFPFVGEAEAVSHLQKGRPLIALLASGRGRHHYVVMLGWTNGRFFQSSMSADG